MSILETLFNKHFGPVFVKQGSDAEEFIAKMKTLSAKASGSLKNKIDEQIAAAESGMFGENQVAFQLKNSGMDMLIAHDVNIEKNGLPAQIDYLVITHKHIFVIECKNLYGNIEIDDKGNFIRHRGHGQYYRKEGMVSPVSQNARHLNVLKEIRKEYKGGVIHQAMFDKVFPKFYRSIVVLSNPKTILQDKVAPKDVRDVVIRADQLVAHIKRIEESDKDLYSSNEKEMRELLDSFIQCSKTDKSDYAKKYEELLAVQCAQESKKGEAPLPATEESGKICPKCGKLMVLRTAKKGENVGQQFWGCSGFPKCWYKET